MRNETPTTEQTIEQTTDLMKRILQTETSLALAREAQSKANSQVSSLSVELSNLRTRFTQVVLPQLDDSTLRSTGRPHELKTVRA